MEFTCECCQYTTTVKSNFTKHLSSNKHIINKYKQTATNNQPIVDGLGRLDRWAPPQVNETQVNEAQVNEAQVNETQVNETQDKAAIFCKYCNKEYKHKSSLSKHNRYSCIKKEEDKEEDLTETQIMIRKMEADIIAFQLEKQELQKQQKIFKKHFEIKNKQIEYLTCLLELRELL